MAVPDRLRIPYEPEEGERFHYVGRFKDGTQFMAFVTGAFPGEERYPDPGDDDWRSIKRWVAVMHKFDAEGNYLGMRSGSAGSTRRDGT